MDGYPRTEITKGTYKPVADDGYGQVNLFSSYFRLYAGQAALSNPAAPPDMMEGEAKLAFALRHFIADYLLAACFGESRHMASQVPTEAYKKADPAFEAQVRPILDRCGRSRAACAEELWGWWPGSREEACTYLESIFSDYVWGDSFGGPNWGYIANMAGEMYRSISLISETSLVDCMIQLDRVAHLIHTGAPILTNPKFLWLGANPWVNKLMGFKRHAMWCCWAYAIETLQPGLKEQPTYQLLAGMPPEHTSVCYCKTMNYYVECLTHDEQQMAYRESKLKSRKKVCLDCMSLMEGDHCLNACPICHVCTGTPHTWHCELDGCSAHPWKEHTHCKDCGCVSYKGDRTYATCRCYCLWCGGAGMCDAYCLTTGLSRGRNRRRRLLRSTPLAINHLKHRKGEEYVRKVLAKEAKRYPPTRVTKWLKFYGLDRHGDPHPVCGKGGSDPVVSTVQS